MLFGCIYAPDFPVQSVLRNEPASASKTIPVAVCDGPDSLQKVIACNAPATRAGLTIGMRKAQAQLLPGVVLRKRAPDQEQAAHSALMDCGYSYSPMVESVCSGTVLMDLTGTERLLGSPEQTGKRLADLAARCGLHVQVALAANVDTALHAARGFPGITVIPEGQEATRLSCLPTEILNPDPELQELLDTWGIRDFGALSSLPRVALIRRLGQRGLQMQSLAQGETERKLAPAEPPLSFQESFELEEPVELLEPLAFILSRVLERLLARLMVRSLATDHLEITLELEIHPDRQLKSSRVVPQGAGRHQRRLKLPVPTQDANMILKLIQLGLAEHPPEAAVKKVIMEAIPAKIRSTQAGLFAPRAPEPVKLEITMARLRAVVGKQDELGRARVGFPATKDSLTPDTFQMLRCHPEEKRQYESSLPCRPAIGFRRVRPPLGIEVEISRKVPIAVLLNGVKRTVINASGPWLRNSSWWSSSDVCRREEWDVELWIGRNPVLCRVFQEKPSGNWFLEAFYD